MVSEAEATEKFANSVADALYDAMMRAELNLQQIVSVAMAVTVSFARNNLGEDVLPRLAAMITEAPAGDQPAGHNG